MKNRALILHIGMPKTGTTSIQDTFGAGHEKLKRLDIYYPPKPPYNHTASFGLAFLENRESVLHLKKKDRDRKGDSRRTIERLKKRWIREFAKCKCHNFMISAEVLCSFDTSEIRAVHEFVTGYFEHIRAIAYVRPPLDLIKSNWGQAVATSLASGTKQEILDSIADKLSYSFISRWKSVLGEDAVTVKAFSRQAFVNDNLIDDILVSVGARAGVFTPSEIKTHNEALGHSAMALLYECNEKYPLFIGNRLNPDKGLARSMRPFLSILNSVGDKKFELEIGLSESRVERLNKEIEDVNRHLRPDECFFHIESIAKESRFPEYEDVSREHIVTLINAYNLYIEQLLHQNRSATRRRRFVERLRHLLARAGI